MKDKILKDLLSPDAIKCIYRANLTLSQAALMLGVGIPKLQKLIDAGEIGINLEDGEIRISREEIFNYLRRKTYYKNNYEKFN